MRPTTCAAWSARAEAGGLVADLADGASCTAQTFAERLLIPAFVFFFQMLYPFAWVNDPGRDGRARPAAACWSGARRWSAAGGIAAIRARDDRRLRAGRADEARRGRSGSA